MTTNARRRSAPLATKGEANEWVTSTSWLLNTPAPVATKPFTSVARPRMEDRSVCGSVRSCAEEMTQDSKAE